MRQAGSALTRLGALAAAIVAHVGCRGCERTQPGGETAKTGGDQTAAPGPTAVGCRLRIAEKLGIPFVFVCAGPEAPAGVARPGFWITAAPLGCSAGEHETVACPTVTPLLERPDRATPAPTPATHAALIDSFTAYRLCALRLAGRFPTRVERTHARAALGMTALLVTESSEPHRLRFSDLPEWVTEAPCTEPSAPEPGCSIGLFVPTFAPYPLPWAGIRRCAARPTTAAVAVGLGMTCDPNGWPADAAHQDLPCAVRSPSAQAGAYALDCEPGAVDTTHPEEKEGAATAAYRCVVPESALASFGEAAEPR